MKHWKYIFLFFTLCSFQVGTAQLSIFTEIAANPIVSEKSLPSASSRGFEDRNYGLYKNLSLGLSYGFESSKLRAGITALDFRRGSSYDAYVDIFILGDLIQSDNSLLLHAFDFHSTSIFLGVEKTYRKLKFGVDFHRAYGTMSNARITVDESFLISQDPRVLHFESEYAPVCFSKIQFKVGYELMKKEKGSIHFFIRGSNDFIDTDDTLIVESYDDRLEDYLHSLPGASMYSLGDFLEKDDLIYNRAIVFFGLEISYKLDK